MGCVTFLIGGDRCTRRCDFCNIDTGKPLPIDREEPRKVAESVQSMGLRYATITGVTRDDLEDEGSWLYAETIRQVHELNPGCGVEMLAPDFHAKPELLNQIFETQPEVFAHNLETVPRIFKRIRPAFTYEKSLQVIGMARDFGLVTKSNLISSLLLISLKVANCCISIIKVTKIKKGLTFFNELGEEEDPLKCPKCKIVHVVGKLDKKMYDTVLGVEELKLRIKKRTDLRLLDSKLSRKKLNL